MEKLQQQQYWRAGRSLLSYKNATIVVCLLNIISAIILLQGFLFPSPSTRLASYNKALFRHIKESEEIRRSMVPVDLIRRVREIGKDVSIETELVKQRDVKQTAAEDLISRLNNFRSYSDVGNVKALEEWRKRKMERAKQRSIER
ncbi:hypothetical protein F511_02808 [Dorcoceras hygrometricum]|uniref:Uncharacterized protein n=1 Tax=Dorcoceras hygrometricum TaxID=472368 RepID=A0A2Z7BIV2_9LAMI|nr:hypothetical protein F511_02808 [Dorcoceras hygrometricum]